MLLRPFLISSDEAMFCVVHQPSDGVLLNSSHPILVSAWDAGRSGVAAQSRTDLHFFVWFFFMSTCGKVYDSVQADLLEKLLVILSFELLLQGILSLLMNR